MVGADDRTVGRHVEHACGQDAAVALFPVFPDGGQVNQHLHIEAVEHVGELEILGARLVIDDADIALFRSFS